MSGLEAKVSPLFFATPARISSRLYLVAGQIDLMWGSANNLGQLRAGSIKAYVVTSKTRLTIAPDIPTVEEVGLPELSFSVWSALFAPKGTPKNVIDSLNTAAVDALADPTVRQRFADIGMEVFPRDQQTPQALGALVKADIKKWWPIIKAANIMGGVPQQPPTPPPLKHK